MRMRRQAFASCRTLTRFLAIFCGDVLFSSSMAALYEGYTLCGRVSGQSLSDSGIRGIEVERDGDHVIVTDSSRSVTLYKVES